MNIKPPSQHEALSQEELELARVVRALPGGEPPAALDAFILKAATDAVASSHPQKKSLWGKGLLGTSALWLGTAAASVLTVGIGWQVFQSMRAPIYELPADENISSVQEIDRSDKDASLVVEVTPAREPMPTSPPPPEAFADLNQAADSAAPVVATEKPKATAPEKREREELARQKMADDAFAKKNDDDNAGLRRDQAAAAAPQAMLAEAPPAPAPPMEALAGAAADRESKEVDSVTVTGSRIARAEATTNQPAQMQSRAYAAGKLNTSIDEDSRLAPDLWLDAIKDRVKRNDLAGAKASLQRYRETHPTLRIPEELKFLLK